MFYKFFKIFTKVCDKYFCAECSPEPNFWRRIALQDKRNSCMKFCLMFPPRTKILAPPLYTLQYIQYIYQLSLVPPPPIFIRGGPHELGTF